MAQKLEMNNLLVLGGIGLIVYFLFAAPAAPQTPAPAAAGTSGTTTVTTSPGVVVTTQPASCAYAPQFTLEAVDKWDTSSTITTNHRYQLNGGVVSTYSAAVEYTKGDHLKVLWANSNGSTYNKDVTEDVVLDACGKKTVSNKELVQNTTFTIACKNDKGIDIDSAANNQTMSAGETASLQCRIIEQSEKGAKHGGICIVELNTTAYQEEKTKLSGSIIGAKVSAPSAYTLASTANKAYAWEIGPIVDISEKGQKDFILTFQAETSAAPSTGDDVLLRCYSKNGYEDQDDSNTPFKIGYVDENEAWTGSNIGSLTVDVDDS